MIVGFDHTSVYIADIRESVAFYRRFLEAEVIREVSLPDRQLTMAYLQIGDSVIELIEKKGSEFLGFHHIAFKTRQIGGEWDGLRRAEKFEPVVPPKKAASGVGEVAFFLDPDRIRVELIDQPEFRREPAGATGTRVAFVSLAITDAGASQRFYTSHLGSRPIAPPVLLEDRSQACFARSGRGIIQWTQIPDISSQGRPGIDHVALSVGDVGLQAERMRECPGIELIPASVDRIRSAGRFTVLGPDGAKFVFHGGLQ